MDKAKLKIQAKELHKKVIRKFPRRPVIVNGVDNVWSIDLVDMQKFSKNNRGYKYILTVIDLLTRYAWAIPLKSKKENEIVDALAKIMSESDRYPKLIWADKEAAFLSRVFTKNFAKVYQTQTDTDFQASYIERWNRTLKEKLWYKFTKHETNQWVNKLQKVVHKYNNTIHSSIGITPEQASERKRGSRGPRAPLEWTEEQYLLQKQDDKLSKVKKSPPKLRIGDFVRLAVSKEKFEKGFTPNWTRELFKIVEVRHTKPPTYKVVDEQGEEIEGPMYEQELQKSQLSW